MKPRVVLFGASGRAGKMRAAALISRKRSVLSIGRDPEQLPRIPGDSRILDLDTASSSETFIDADDIVINAARASRNVPVHQMLEHVAVRLNHSAGGIFRHDQESAAGRIGNTAKTLDDVMAKKAPARKDCAWAGTRGVAALTRCDGIALRTAPGGSPRPKRNGIDPI